MSIQYKFYNNHLISILSLGKYIAKNLSL